ncbi:hypothetical protein TRICHSKD4_6281 [Roseibium sp. TrichSKD4]|uniref:hypothetical protein n=1 Tax=Roseibium sp. TrichSKD4 TaxID=744980 RepID=UPI0001E57387|nr:hypothetical protein [Roseibium sp. TrichSKD4]EFO28576.1 hypothetical protein TRICHSKD4_6281 [Roseibium sp. TrichSKD4]
MRDLKKLQFLVESRERAARAEMEAAKRQHLQALQAEQRQGETVNEYRENAESRRRQRNRELLSAPASTSQLALNSLQFALSKEEINNEIAKLTTMTQITRDSEIVVEERGLALRHLVMKQKKLEELQKKIAKLHRRKDLHKSNSG